MKNTQEKFNFYFSLINALRCQSIIWFIRQRIRLHETPATLIGLLHNFFFTFMWSQCYCYFCMIRMSLQFLENTLNCTCWKLGGILIFLRGYPRILIIMAELLIMVKNSRQFENFYIKFCRYSQIDYVFEFKM